MSDLECKVCGTNRQARAIRAALIVLAVIGAVALVVTW
jgi:hypothetical protein